MVKSKSDNTVKEINHYEIWLYKGKYKRTT